MKAALSSTRDQREGSTDGPLSLVAVFENSIPGPPKYVCKIITRRLSEQPKKPLFYIVLGSRYYISQESQASRIHAICPRTYKRIATSKLIRTPARKPLRCKKAGLALDVACLQSASGKVLADGSRFQGSTSTLQQPSIKLQVPPKKNHMSPIKCSWKGLAKTVPICRNLKIHSTIMYYP